MFHVVFRIQLLVIFVSRNGLITSSSVGGERVLFFCYRLLVKKSNRKAMNRNWSNQKANPALKTKTGNK